MDVLAWGLRQHACPQHSVYRIPGMIAWSMAAVTIHVKIELVRSKGARFPILTSCERIPSCHFFIPAYG